VGPHGGGQLQQHIVGFAGIGRGQAAAGQEGAQGRAIVEEAVPFVDELEVVAAQHGHVHKLAETAGAAVLHHQQAGLYYFEHEAQRRHPRGRAPHVEAVGIVPHAQAQTGLLHGGRQLE
jgi:hypothetical protein